MGVLKEMYVRFGNHAARRARCDRDPSESRELQFSARFCNRSDRSRVLSRVFPPLSCATIHARVRARSFSLSFSVLLSPRLDLSLAFSLSISLALDSWPRARAVYRLSATHVFISTLPLPPPRKVITCPLDTGYSSDLIIFSLRVSYNHTARLQASGLIGSGISGSKKYSD